VSRVALLDVNVLLALFDPHHVHHDTAHDWFEEHSSAGWASCPVTENGFVRTANVAARTGEFVPMATLIDRLRAFQRAGGHEFWHDDVSLLDNARFDARRIHGNRQVTDVYLLALAVAHDAQLVTFDARIPVAAVKGARRDHLVVLASAE
jgi:toxin-antitoxin system PIN domain toxin